MKARTTLILLVVVVAIGAYIKFYESKRPNTEEAARQEKMSSILAVRNSTGLSSKMATRRSN